MRLGHLAGLRFPLFLPHNPLGRFVEAGAATHPCAGYKAGRFRRLWPDLFTAGRIVEARTGRWRADCEAGMRTAGHLALPSSRRRDEALPGAFSRDKSTKTTAKGWRSVLLVLTSGLTSHGSGPQPTLWIPCLKLSGVTRFCCRPAFEELCLRRLR